MMHPTKSTRVCMTTPMQPYASRAAARTIFMPVLYHARQGDSSTSLRMPDLRRRRRIVEASLDALRHVVGRAGHMRQFRELVQNQVGPVS